MRQLFKDALGADFERMPAAIRELHGLRAPTVFRGIAQVDGAAGCLGALLARLFRLPPAGSDLPVEVTITPDKDHESWRRQFGDFVFATTLGTGGHARQLTESFGWVRFKLNLESHERGLDMSIAGAQLGIVTLPRFAIPWTIARERVDASGRFTFDVEIGPRGIGRLVWYRGWLVL